MEWSNLLNEGRLKPSTRNTDGDERNEFESDFGRIIFSPAIRRMHDKTQVFPLTEDDNIHSRLTHSLEVMSVGESIALNIVKNKDFLNKTTLDPAKIEREIPVIIKNACLIHDIGNPPFGHFGETIFQEYFKNLFEKDKENVKNGASPRFSLTDAQRGDFENFDGNAQGLRVITKLQVLDDAYGLNLSYATIGSFIKYPNPNEIGDVIHLKKRGVFQSERDYFKKIVTELGIGDDVNCYRHPFSFIVEAADSICYLVMDLEDGYNKKWYSFEKIKSELSQIDGMNEIFESIEKRANNDVTKIVNLRLSLIKKLVTLTINNFINNLEDIYNGKYNFELIKDDSTNLAEKLNLFCVRNVFSNKEITSLELTGHSVLTGLLDYFIDFCFSKSKDYRKRTEGLISNSIKRAVFLETGKEELKDLDDYYRLRVIVDYISGMTDQYALHQFQKLSGQKLF